MARLCQLSRFPALRQSARRCTTIVDPSHVLSPLFDRHDSAILDDIKVDPESAALYPNRTSRPVHSGHWVHVEPTPLQNPQLLSYTPALAESLGLDQSACESPEFLQLFSGGVEQAGAYDVLTPWATPYAVSVRGVPQLAPDQFGGFGYGDGRAVSLGVFRGAKLQNWELQLKGAGQTPFSRQFDGRAVLRSSIREFLVSEAMHHLGIPTTRALSLIASRSEFVSRPWYEEDVDLQSSGNEEAEEIDLSMAHQPNRLVRERCAIVCRAAPSFLRVGHVELFSRRARNEIPGGKEQLQLLLNHAIRREFPSLLKATSIDEGELGSSPQLLLRMLEEFAERQAELVTHWMRVGYVQGNMNSDNCLLSGRTMDYGPFGFVQLYSPLWSPFTSDPEGNYGFENQPSAAYMNLATLAWALMPLIPRGEISQVEGIVNEKFPRLLNLNMWHMRRAKLGLPAATEQTTKEITEPLVSLLQTLDFTIFWRQLSTYPAAAEAGTDEELLQPLLAAMYPGVTDVQRKGLIAWLRRWLREVGAAGVDDARRQAAMRAISPKYIPRESMLFNAYQAAEKGDLSPLKELKNLFASPYDEHPALEGRYFLRASKKALETGGIAFYS